MDGILTRDGVLARFRHPIELMMTYTNSLLKKRRLWRCRAIATAVLALLLSFQPIQHTNVASNAVADSPTAPAALNLLWKHQIATPLSLAACKNANYVATIDRKGNITCYGVDGELVWKIALPGVNRIVLGPDGGALAYSYLDILNTTAYIIGPDGKLRWQQEVSGAIWSADASKDPGVFAVGTGERYCYRYNIGKCDHHYRRWRIPGAPCTLSFAPDGKSLFFGTWQDAGTSSYTLDGRQIVEKSGKEDRLYCLDTGADGSHVIVVSTPNRKIPEGTVHLKDMNLDDCWVREFQVGNLVSDVSVTGDYVAVGFDRVISHKEKRVVENRIALFDQDGRMLWEKGGLFGIWDLMQITAADHILVHDDSGYIYFLSLSGTVLLRHKLPSAVHLDLRVPSRDKAVVYCNDGQLMVFSVR